MGDILDVVLHDEESIATEIVPIKIDDSIAHYGRLGMKWYQHIYGEYQGAAKYAEKGARRVDRLQERGQISAAKRLRKKVDKYLSIAEKEKEMSVETKRKIAESVNEHSSDKEVQEAAKKIQKFEETSKASDAIIDELRQDRINDLTRGVADWKKASSEDISAAITRLNLEKQYKDIRDDVSGAKVWKEAGAAALKSVAGSSGKILEEVVKTAGNIAEEKNKAKLAEDKDVRTWNREDETHQRDRKEKLQDQAREDRNAELKSQRDIAKEEAKNRADYLNAQTAAKKAEGDRETKMYDRNQVTESDKAVREVLEGTRSEASLTPTQAQSLTDYVDRMFSGTKNTRQVLDDNESARQQAKAKAEAEAEAKAQREFNEKNYMAYLEASEAKRREREEGAKITDQEIARRNEEHERDQQRKRVQEAAEKAERERASAEQHKQKAEKEAALDAVNKRREEASAREAAESKKRAEAAASESKRQAAEKESAYDFFKGLQDSKRSDSSPKSSDSGGSTESTNDHLLRNLSEMKRLSAYNQKVVEAAGKGSSVLGKLGIKLKPQKTSTPTDYSSRNAGIIRAMSSGNKSAEEIAKQYGVSVSTVYDVYGGVSHSSVSVFRRMSREEYYATYKGLKWKSS